MKLTIIFGIIIIISASFYVYSHEQVHVSIYEDYGIDSRVEYFSNFPYAVTIAESGCPTNECLLAQEMNEAVGYHLNPLLAVLSIGLFFIIIILELIWERIE